MPHSTSNFGDEFQIFDSVADIPDFISGCVVAIGNFDGVHRGHRAVLDSALEHARKKCMPAIVVTFEPHPRTVFRPEHPVFRLSQPEAKIDIFDALGFDGVLVIPFDKSFAKKSAESFVIEILVNKLKICHIAVGYDFHFGKDRKGTPKFLKESGKKHNFGVSIIDQFEDEQSAVVSSSRIREALSAGDIVIANSLLGYRWFVDAVVQHGEKRGRTLGFPTANLHLPEEYRLQLGIYAVRVYLNGRRYEGVASYGRRPTFDNGNPILEVFLFDFSDDIYGETLRVAFYSFLRPELKFTDVDSLVAQMKQDVLEAQAALANLQPLSELDVILDQECESK